MCLCAVEKHLSCVALYLNGDGTVGPLSSCFLRNSFLVSNNPFKN